MRKRIPARAQPVRVAAPEEPAERFPRPVERYVLSVRERQCLLVSTLLAKLAGVADDQLKRVHRRVGRQKAAYLAAVKIVERLLAPVGMHLAEEYPLLDQRNFAAV